MMVKLPYGLTAKNVRSTIRYTEDYFFALKKTSRKMGIPHIIDIIPSNSLSSLVSDLMISGLCKHVGPLNKNCLTGGYPDLLPSTKYKTVRIKNGASGLEIKSSKNSFGWQGHNADAGWFMGINYAISKSRDLVITGIYVSRLNAKDWNFHPRKNGSRRTPTASLAKAGRDKLRKNAIYQFGV